MAAFARFLYCKVNLFSFLSILYSLKGSEKLYITEGRIFIWIFWNSSTWHSFLLSLIYVFIPVVTHGYLFYTWSKTQYYFIQTVPAVAIVSSFFWFMYHSAFPLSLSMLVFVLFFSTTVLHSSMTQCFRFVLCISCTSTAISSRGLDPFTGKWHLKPRTGWEV